MCPSPTLNRSPDPLLTPFLSSTSLCLCLSFFFSRSHRSLPLLPPRPVPSQCEFLESDVSVLSSPRRSPQRPPLSPCTLRVAASDLQQLMSTFGHIYYDFKGYCEKPPPKPPLHTDTFQTVGQLLQASNMVRRFMFQYTFTLRVHIYSYTPLSHL